MPDTSDNPSDADLSAAGVASAGQPDSRPEFTSAASSSSTASMNPRAYYGAAWRLAKRDLFVFLWKLLADTGRAAVRGGIVVAVGAVVAVEFADALAAPGRPLSEAVDVAAHMATPQFIVGATGVLFCGWLISITIDALVLSGIWGTFAAGAGGEPIRRLRTFAVNLTARFPAVLGLRITTLAAQLLVVVVGLSVFAAVVVATTGDGAFAGASVWSRGLVWAAPATALAGLAALVRLTMEVAVAPLLMEGRSLGDSILQAAGLVCRRFVDVYRLVVFAAGLLLAPLFLYWAVLLFGNLTSQMSAVAPLVGLLRVGAGILLFASTGVISVLFYGAMFVYYAHLMGIDHDLTSGDESSGDGRPGRCPSLTDAPRSGGVGFDRTTTLEELLPDEYPNIVSLDDVVGSTTAAKTADKVPSPREPTDGEGAPEPARKDAPATDDAAEFDPVDTPTDGDELSGDDVFDSDPTSDNHDRD